MNPARTIRFVQIGDQIPGEPLNTLSAEFEVTREDSSTFPIAIPIGLGNHTTIAGRPVWGWDGDRARPTLEPSIRCDWGAPPELLALGMDGQREVFHGYLRAGRIELCADSTVETP
jgi:hypothetical protein